MTFAGSSATLTEADAYALGRSYAALATAKAPSASPSAATAAPIRPSSKPRWSRPDRRRARRRADRHGPLADALFRDLDARRRRRHPGHRQPQSGRLQRLQDAAERPLGVRRGDPGARPPRRRRATGARARARSSEVDIVDAYVDAAGQGFSTARPSGSAGTPATAPPGRSLEKLVERLPGEHHTCSTPRSTARFPNHHPDPTVEANLADLKQLVADKQLDFGIAFDGDGDRIGAVDGKGRVIWGDQLLMILAEPVLKEQPGATIIADVKASQTLFDRIAELGGKPLMWKTGHSLIKSKMKETGAPLAGEMSGHIFFKHRWYGFDDALYAAVRLIEAVSAERQVLTESWTRCQVGRHARAALPGRRSRKFAVVDEVRDRLAADGAKVDATDGVRVSTADGWWLLRASNTQDVLVARAEAKTRPDSGRRLDRLVAADRRAAGEVWFVRSSIGAIGVLVLIADQVQQLPP
jgi:phosphomannomutase